MSAIDCAVDAVPLIVVVLTERFEQTLPDPLTCRAVEPVEHRLPGTKIAREISPRSPRPPPPQHRFHEVAVVPPRPPGALPHAQRRFDSQPLPLIQLQANHRGRLMEHTLAAMESSLLPSAAKNSARPAG